MTLREDGTYTISGRVESVPGTVTRYRLLRVTGCSDHTPGWIEDETLSATDDDTSRPIEFVVHERAEPDATMLSGSTQVGSAVITWNVAPGTDEYLAPSDTQMDDSDPSDAGGDE